MSQITVNVMINMVVEQHRWRYTLLLITTACLVVQLSNEKEHDLYCFVLSLSLSRSLSPALSLPPFFILSSSFGKYAFTSILCVSNMFL